MSATRLETVLLLQVNYHASNEYESVPNYKVLQQGFTAITLTRVSADRAGAHMSQPCQPACLPHPQHAGAHTSTALAVDVHAEASGSE